MRRIRARGGDVVLVRLPVSDALWTIADRVHRRDLSWDRFAARPGIRTIHFRDDPRMAALECPDLSHLGRDGALRFTDLLAEAIAAPGGIDGVQVAFHQPPLSSAWQGAAP